MRLQGKNVTNFGKLDHFRRIIEETFCLETNVIPIKVLKWPYSASLNLYFPCNFKPTTAKKAKIIGAPHLQIHIIRESVMSRNRGIKESLLNKQVQKD